VRKTVYNICGMSGWPISSGNPVATSKSLELPRNVTPVGMVPPSWVVTWSQDIFDPSARDTKKTNPWPGTTIDPTNTWALSKYPSDYVVNTDSMHSDTSRGFCGQGDRKIAVCTSGMSKGGLPSNVSKTFGFPNFFP